MTGQTSWRVAPAPYAEVRSLAAELSISEVLAQILVRRGLRTVEDAHAFLHPDYRVHNPYAMAGMREARRRVDEALKLGEQIAVHGDYDADGITATFLVSRVLQELGGKVRRRLPNRFSEGYGVSIAAVEELAEAGVRLLVTVDCGITAHAAVTRARELGMDVIVTDHHEREGGLPDCIVLTPKVGGYPCRDLAGVGVAFKLCHALLEEPDDQLAEIPLALRPLTDVVAIGTIADMVPLLGENRVLATVGLGRLRSAPRPGLATLMEVADVRPETLTSGQVGYRLAPRLNAAGRLEDASLALELLDAATRADALPPALRLSELNRERQAIEAAILADACAMVPDPAPPALVLSSSEWHEGVVGIVASRVAERFHRPTILLSEGHEEAKGSGRSVASFDILTAVEAAAEHLLAFGGHRAACGVRLRTEHIGAFRTAFVATVAESIGDNLAPVREVDALVGGHELTLALSDELDLLAPHGFGNRAVTLLLRGAELQAPRLTRNGRHMQYRVRCDGVSCPAIHFNFSDLDSVAGEGRRDLLLRLTRNEYNGAISAQVEVRELAHCADAGCDLCATACDTACEERPRGAAFWRSLPSRLPRDGGAFAPEDVADQRVVDRRGRPLAPLVAALAGGGERVLVLVSDLARRRPLLADELVAPHLGQRGLYVQAACVGRLQEAAGAAVVMAGQDVVAIASERDRAALSDIAHVVFADPPFSRELLALAADSCPTAWLHFAWGRAQLDFTESIRQAEYDLQATARVCWRLLRSGAGRFDDRLERELLAGMDRLPPTATLAAALAVLQEADLLHVDDDAYELEHPGTKVDITQTNTYRRWHRLFQTRDLPWSCRTAPA